MKEWLLQWIPLRWRYKELFIVACERNPKRRFPHYYRLYGKRDTKYFLIHQALIPQSWWLELKPMFTKQISRLDVPYLEFNDNLEPL